MRELTLIWMYHNIMDLYGDKGNILVFQQRCRAYNINLNIMTVGIGEAVDFSQADIVFIGGGADREQGAMYEDLLSRKILLGDAISKGVLFLLICGGYQLFGKYYEDADGHRLEGLGLLDYFTVSDGSRSIGNIIVQAEMDEQTYVFAGFENHGGKTYNVKTPFGKVLYGHGNDDTGYEGYFDGQILGTYMHGPLLPKNVEIADYFIMTALLRKGENAILETLDDSLNIKARNCILKRYFIKSSNPHNERKTEDDEE